MRASPRPFLDPLAHGFRRVAAGVPRVRPGDPAANAAESAALAREAAARGVSLLVLPEMGLSGYAIGDLVQQAALLAACERALGELASDLADLPLLVLCGMPLSRGGRLYNVAVALAGGVPIAVAPKSYLPNHREFYEARWFTPAGEAHAREVELLGRRVPFGADVLLRCEDDERFTVFVELCEDLWVPAPPSTDAALAGATVLANLSASNALVGKADWRRLLVRSQSGRCVAALVYASAGAGESTTDLAWDGHAMIGENGVLLAEGERYRDEAQLVVADVDLERLVLDRARQTTFGRCAATHAERLARFRTASFRADPPAAARRLEREVERRPYVPADPARRDERCREVLAIQATALAHRMRAARVDKLVVGVSGGLDSTLALLVSVRAVERLGLPRENVLAYTLPALATSRHTLETARELMAALGVNAGEIDLSEACRRVLTEIDHPAARGEPVFDTTYENVQAGERTSRLFRLANRHGALVVGTGDLSELALGWCTYGVGDQMSHYAVNASVPKTLVRHLVEWCAAQAEGEPRLAAALRRVLDTRISPELVPGDGERPAQDTEELLGPFELHDFFLYHATRFGFGPAKLLFLALAAFREAGGADEPARTPEEIRRTLRVFLERFLARSQFKRSALPDGPKIGSGGALSPRGDWRAPSDATAAAWLAELEEAERRWDASES